MFPSRENSAIWQFAHQRYPSAPIAVLRDDLWCDRINGGVIERLAEKLQIAQVIAPGVGTFASTIFSPYR